MANIEDFVGTYTIRTACGKGPVIKPLQTLYIGTGTNGARQPAGDQIGVSIFEPAGSNAAFPKDPLLQPALFSHDARNGCLTWRGSWKDGSSGQEQPLQMQLSLFTDPASNYKAPYALIVIGDPQQVGSFGADDDPDPGVLTTSEGP